MVLGNGPAGGRLVYKVAGGQESEHFALHVLKDAGEVDATGSFMPSHVSRVWVSCSPLRRIKG